MNWILSILKYAPLVGHIVEAISKVLKTETDQSSKGKISKSEVAEILEQAVPVVLQILKEKVE